MGIKHPVLVTHTVAAHGNGERIRRLSVTGQIHE
jgi:hypothetical protein